ncbi:MAG: hypothetical protein AAGA54_21570 [Myxococcota bacterium]
MNRRLAFRSLAVLSCLLPFAGCDDAAAPEDEAPAAGGKADDADGLAVCEELTVPTFVDPGTDDGRARVEAVQAYADALIDYTGCQIDAELADDGITDHSFAGLYDFRIGQCQREDLDGDDDKLSELVAHAEYTVDFLAEFHRKNWGRPAITFDTVELCPADQMEVDMELDLSTPGGTLRVGSDYGGWFGVGESPTSAREIEDWWNEGLHVKAMVGVTPDWNPFNNRNELLVQGAWAIFNPIGSVRGAMRNRIAQRALASIGNLRDALSGDDEEVRSATMRLAEDAVATKVDGLDDDVAACLEELPTDRIVQLAEAWETRMNDADAWSAVERAAVGSAMDVAEQSRTEVEITQDCGLFSFGNLKIIDVDLHFATIALGSGHERYAPFLQFSEVDELDVNVDQSGLLCFYLIDDVDVNVSVGATLTSISVDQAVQASGLADAMRDVDIDCGG